VNRVGAGIESILASIDEYLEAEQLEFTANVPSGEMQAVLDVVSPYGLSTSKEFQSWRYAKSAFFVCPTFGLLIEINCRHLGNFVKKEPATSDFSMTT
jgi:hypothetical protein